MKNPLIKFIKEEDHASIFHSSVHARAQSEGHLGAASSETFRQREALNQNRQYIKQYKESRLATGVNQYCRAKTYEPAAQAHPAPQPPTPRPIMPKNPGINPGIHR